MFGSWTAQEDVHKHFKTMDVTTTQSFFRSFGISLLVFLFCTSWVLAIDKSGYGEACISFVNNFVITLGCLQYFKVKNETHYNSICSGVILGRCFLVLPVCIIYNDAYYSLFFLISSIIGTLLAALCYKKRNIGTYILSFILFILTTTILYKGWDIWFNAYL